MVCGGISSGREAVVAPGLIFISSWHSGIRTDRHVIGTATHRADKSFLSLVFDKNIKEFIPLGINFMDI